MYYKNKIESLRQIFGVDEISVNDGNIKVGNKSYPVIDDVIILLDKAQYPTSLQHEEFQDQGLRNNEPAFAEDIQYTFGEEWKTFNQVLPEHEIEFNEYFDIVDLAGLRNKRVCDMGCGIGRWAYFLSSHVGEIVLVDFSEAIFEARHNLRKVDTAIFIMGDIKNLPFADDSMDFVYCLGVLHHLPAPALDEVRALAKYSPNLLIYIYYSLDNRPFYFRVLLAAVTIIRLMLARIRMKVLRGLITEILTWVIYLPCVGLGHLLDVLNMGRYVPLYQGYRGKSIKRIRQDVYDRFFTRIEQRFSRVEIDGLRGTFSEVVISDGLPYWHFLCKR